MGLIWFLVGAALAGGFAQLFTNYNLKRKQAEPSETSFLFGGFGVAFVLGGMTNGVPASVGAGVALIVVSAYGWWWSRQRSELRDRAAASLAVELGLERSKPDLGPEATLLVESLQPGLKHMGEKLHKIERLLIGTHLGVKVKVFEYRYWVSAGGRGVATQHPFICAMAESPGAASEIQIRPAAGTHLLGKIFREPSVDLGDDSFKMLFIVQSDDPAAAQGRLDARIRSWLTANGKGMSFLIGRSAILGMCPRDSRAPAAVLDTVLGLRAQLYPSTT